MTERYNMTFREVFEAWKEEHYKEIGPRGVESYNRAFDVFQPLHDARFRSLRTADFQVVMDKYADKSHSTCSKYKQLVTQMSAWAIREEIATTSFAKFIHLPENVKKEKERRKKTFPILRPLRPGPINWKGKPVTARNAEKNTM